MVRLRAVRWPVIVVGDLNADPLHRNGTATFDSFVLAGFKDAWSEVHPTDRAGGLTWGHDELLADPTVALIWRIDLVLYRGKRIAATDADAIDLGLNRTQPPLWASATPPSPLNSVRNSAILNAESVRNSWETSFGTWATAQVGVVSSDLKAT